MAPPNVSRAAFRPNNPVCTVLIPRELLSFLESRLAQFRKRALARYLASLLRRYQGRARLRVKGRDRLTTGYQAEGLGLEPLNFRCPIEDWVELKMLAQVHGVSACRLFVLLVLWDRARSLHPGIGKVGTPSARVRILRFTAVLWREKRAARRKLWINPRDCGPPPRNEWEPPDPY
ncbi:MAG: DUF1564 family protein [Spirochaetales bacterium]|nr:DUF1564 family protein [Spirochaetales bacterium]